MKIAIPTAGGRLCMHFGHCQQFAIVEVDDGTKNIIGETMITPPPHEPGLYPAWLAQMGVSCIISGGMGGRAQQIFEDNKINVVTGASALSPAEIVRLYLDNKLETGENTCGHGPDHVCND